MTFQLRPYQVEAIQAVQADWAAGLHSVLVTAASGVGKTEIFTALIADELSKHPKARVLIVCHRRDLIDQAFARLQLRFPKLGKRAGIVMAAEDDAGKQIVISTIQTLVELKRTESLLAAGPIDYLIRDEAHRAVTLSDKVVYNRLREANPNLLHLGVTATPIRADKRGLVEAYEKESYHYGIKEAVAASTLVPPRWLAIQTGISIDGVKSNGGDYSAKDLANVYETDNCLDLVVESHKKYAHGRRAMAFTASVVGAYKLAEAFKKAGYKAAAADGTTKHDARDAILSDFRTGKLDVLCNCALYTEGLDVPEISCVHQVRPTKSDGMYVQMVGRGLRTAPGKSDCLILDYAPIDARNVVMLGDVLGVPARKDVYLRSGGSKGEVVGGFTMDSKGVKFLVGDANELVSRELDYLDLTPWTWYRSSDGTLSLSLGEASDGLDRILFIRPAADGYNLYGIARENARANRVYLVESGDLDAVTARAEQSINNYGNAILAAKGKQWRRQRPSQPQLDYASRLGINARGANKGELSQMITHKIALRLIERNF